jgi:hypothetical protein
MVRQALSPSEHTRCEQNVVDYDKKFYIDFCSRFAHKGLSLAHEGRLLEAILLDGARRGVSRLRLATAGSRGIKRVYARRNALGGPARQAL